MTEMTFKKINYTVNETGTEIRRALRARFPGVKFSLRGSRGTGYGRFSLSWVDGPTTSAVDAVTNGFRSSYFDGMDDSTHSIPATMYAAPDGSVVEHAFSCNGVNTSRSFSVEAVAWATSYIDAHGGPDIFCSDYGRDNYHTAVYRVLSGIDLCGVNFAEVPTVTPGYSGRHVAQSYCVETRVWEWDENQGAHRAVEVSL